MTDERRAHSPWLVRMLLAIAALLALRFLLHSVAHVVDLVSTVVVLGGLGLVGANVALGRRRSRHRD